MENLLYGELSSRYRLLDPPEDHAEEAEIFRMAFIESIDGPAKTLIELGAGAGHNALTLRAAFDCTLLDLSESMLALSQVLNPTCRHELGDMRTLRLGRVFDAVLVHDAICHMNTEADVTAIIETAWLGAADASGCLSGGGSGPRVREGAWFGAKELVTDLIGRFRVAPIDGFEMGRHVADPLIDHVGGKKVLRDGAPPS